MATNIVFKEKLNGGVSLGGGGFAILGRSISASSEGEISLRVEYACLSSFASAKYFLFQVNQGPPSNTPAALFESPEFSVLGQFGAVGTFLCTNVATKTERGITYVTATYSAPLVGWFTTTSSTSERTFFKSVESLNEDNSRVVSTITFDYTATTVTTTSKFEQLPGSGEIPPSPPRNIRTTGNGGGINYGVKFVTNESVTRGSSGLYVYQTSVTGIYDVSEGGGTEGEGGGEE
jgi:hypothetical protein